MDIINWIEKNLQPSVCTSEKFIYNEMASQSDYSLPIIYEPFDGMKKSHWADRGDLFDYLYSTDGENKKVLDFGPGDGWPSLIVAPYVKEVIGVDSSFRRIEVCTKNAKRLGITNAKFIKYSADEPLPFDDNTFDGVMAASSVEQTPDPKKTLSEIFRVLKPGGRFRIYYEAMSSYRNGQENDIWIAEISEKSSKLIIYIRNIEEEYEVQYGITIAMPRQKLEDLLKDENNIISFDKITIGFLEKIKSNITNTQVCKLTHPSGKTLLSWLKEIGFKEILPSHSGRTAAIKLFDQYSETERPKELKDIDEAVKNVVKAAVQQKVPIEMEPMITAIK